VPLKTKKNQFLKISVFISIVIHIIAIGSINHLEIRSFISSKNISFANKTNAQLYKKKSPTEILNIVLKEKKQKKLQFLIEKNKTISLPLKEKKEQIVNDYSYQKELTILNEFVFTSTHAKEIFQLIEKEKILPNFKTETNDLPISSSDIKYFAKSESQKQIESITLPNNETTNKISLDLEKILIINANHLLKFNELSDKENALLDEINKLKQKKIQLFPYNFSLINMPELSDLATLSCKDYFNIEVTFSPQINEKGYIFAITLIPKSSIKLHRLKQNIFFLIDKSNSIQKDRLTSTRHAIASSLSFLNEEDSFNILAFDTKLDVLSNNNLKNDNISLSRAKGFLRKQNIGSFFSSTNFSIPLYKILDDNVKKDEINIAILLSNGDGLHKFKNYRILNDWTKLNGGNLSLFTLGLNDDKNLSILELFSNLNKGKLLYSTTSKGIKRKLQKLLKSLNYPIAKDLVVNTICLDNKTNITLYPPSHQSPNIYINEPYVILGTIDKLQDFTIFLQGKCKNSFFNLKKHINFDQAKQVGISLQKELAIKQASLCYEKYLTDNNTSHLQEAENHLEPFEIKPVFR
jgi:hypothetical protein